MSGPAGQALSPLPPPPPAPPGPPPPRRAGRRLAAALRGLAGVLAVTVGLGLAAAAALGIRLTQGPMHVTWLLRQFAGRQPHGAHLALGQATLMWDRRAPQSLLVLDIANPVLTRADGSVAARARQARIAVLPAKLLAGQLRPVAIGADGASLALLRTQDGALTLDAGGPPPPHPPAVPDRTWRRLARVSLHAADIILTDRALGTVWRVHVAALQLQHADAAAIGGAADLTVRAAAQSSHILATLAPLTLSPGTPGTPGRCIAGTWTAFVPSGLGLAAGEPLDLPVAGRFQASLDPDWTPRALSAALAFGSGQILAGGGAIPVAGGQAALQVDPRTRHATLTQARLALAASDHAAGPVLAGQGSLDWTAPRAQARLALDLDRVAFAALGRYWPPGLARGARDWITTNITAGAVTAAHADLAAAIDHGAAALTAATGHLHGQDLTIAWLRPAPPLLHAAAELTLDSADALTVAIPSAIQAPSDPASPPLGLGPGTLRITGLAAPHQTAVIQADLAGPVPQLVALLREPRLRLLASHPLDLGAPSGTVRARLQVRLPLDNDVPIDRIAIRATGDLAALHLGGIVGGKDLDDGALALQASNDGLALTGPAKLAGIPSSLAVRMDFRAGPPGQMVARYTASGTAALAQLQAAGLPTGGLAEGSVGYTADLVERRDGGGAARVHVDLRAASLQLGALGWRKSRDADSTADALVRLDHDRVVAVEGLSVTGPGVLVQAHATYAAGRPVSLVLDRIELGATRAAGELRFPTAADPALHADLHGPVLDLGNRMKPDADRRTPGRAEAQAAARARRTVAQSAPPAIPGRPWQADLHFDRVILGPGPGHDLTDISAGAENDGLLIQRAQVTGQAGQGRFRMALTPQGAGRALHADAQDAGGLLRALDLTPAVDGGRLSLTGAYDDRQPDHPLAGTAAIERFRVVGAPAVARLLQAMTLYGVVDVLRGPGLGITHLVAPFRYADAVLSLDNARAFSSSLGFTSRGDIDLAAQRADLAGTIVPGYFFNTLLGKLPVLGRLFSPEQGGGVFAASYKLTGPLAAPKVQINPLSALTPGFLRGLFGVFDTPR